MKLLALDTPERLALAAGWLAQPENYQWLDFGGGRRVIPLAVLRVMVQRPAHFLRLYTSEDGEPVGLVGLNGIDDDARTGTFWGLSGDKSFRHRGLSTIASSVLLRQAFRDLGLVTVNTWAVAHNPSVRVIERLGFRLAGRQRQCHRIDGVLYDRLFFDLLAPELREIGERRVRRVRRARQVRARAEPLAAVG